MRCPKQTMRLLLTLPILLILAAPSSSLAQSPDGPEEREAVVTGSKLFTESVILGEALAVIARENGHPATHRRELGGSAILLGALRSGEIDAYVEYTGTLLGELFADRNFDSLAQLRFALAEEGLQMTDSLGFNNTYAIGMARERAEALGITSIADLADHPNLRMAFSNEFVDRADGWPGLRRTYDLPHSVRGIDHQLAYRALAEGQIDVTDLYATDAEIAYYDLVVLTDDRSYFPEYAGVILYREDLIERAPAVAIDFERLAGNIGDSEMVRYNERAKIDGEREAVVARSLVTEQLGLDAQGEDASGSAGAGVADWARGAAVRIGWWTLEHLRLVVVAMVAGIAVSIPLGVLAAKSQSVGRLVLPATGILQTIPSLALLAFMIPLLPLIGLSGLGFWPAVVALFLYSLLPMVRNTQAGLVAIPRPVMESAEALGLTPWQRLTKVELPLAAPTILAGIKTSVVITVGFATLGAFIGAGGYGQPILTGLRRDDNITILEGAIPAALMAIIAQVGLDVLSRVVVSRGLTSRR